jgi:hypothetical protein
LHEEKEGRAMRDRLKILDCNRLGILKLPDSAFKLWFCRYMNEDDENESWVSIDTIIEQTKMSRRTIIRANKYLVENGWLVDTGKTAADKLLERGKMPSKGAYQCRVFRADDPCSAKRTPEEISLSGVETASGAISTSANLAPKVLLGSGSGSGSASNSLQVGVAAFSTRLDSDLIQAADAAVGTAPLVEEGKAKPKPKPKPQTKTKKQHVAKDGTPYPEDFFNWSDNIKRTEWLCSHDPSFLSIRTLADLEEKRLLMTTEEIEREYSKLMDELDEDSGIYIPAQDGMSVPKGEKPKTTNQNPKPRHIQTFEDDEPKCATTNCSKEGMRYAPNGALLCFTCWEKNKGTKAKGATR